MKKIIALFAEPAAAEAAAKTLQAAGFSPLSIARLHSVQALWCQVGGSAAEMLATWAIFCLPSTGTP